MQPPQMLPWLYPLSVSHRLLQLIRVYLVIPSAQPIRKGIIMANIAETNWRLHLESVKWAASSLPYQAFPELSERAQREAEEFGKLPPPKDAAEMALMIAKSSIMQASWSTEFLSRAAMQANAEMRSSTQRVLDALLHRPATP